MGFKSLNFAYFEKNVHAGPIVGLDCTLLHHSDTCSYGWAHDNHKHNIKCNLFWGVAFFSWGNPIHLQGMSRCTHFPPGWSIKLQGPSFYKLPLKRSLISSLIPSSPIVLVDIYPLIFWLKIVKEVRQTKSFTKEY